MGDDSCENCTAGKFSDGRDLVSCKDCPKAYYANSKLSNDGKLRYDRCLGCPRGTYGDELALSTVSHCKYCIAGRYNDVDGSLNGCQDCPEGKYSANERNTKDSDCEDCDSGTYSSTKAAQSEDSCVDCLVSKFSDHVGASGEDECQFCELGYEQKSPGMAYCLPCTPGKHGTKDTSGSFICETCGNNFYSDKTAQVSSFYYKFIQTILRLMILSHLLNLSFFFL